MKAIHQRSTFGRNLLRLRLERKLTQLELATLTGLDRALIATYETQHIDPPLSAVLLLAKALGVSLPELAEDPGEAQSPESRDALEVLVQLDPRTARKAVEIAALPKEQRAAIYSILKEFQREEKSGAQLADSHQQFNNDQAAE